MNLALLPLLLTALLMASADGNLDTAHLLLAGRHALDDRAGTVVVGDADVAVPVTADVPGPLYVIGGEVELAGRVRGDVVQLAGVLHVGPEATVGGELRHVAGSLDVSPDATVAARSDVAITREATGDEGRGLVATGLVAAMLAVVAARLARTRPHLLDNVGTAVSDHPVVTLTVGVLAALTAIAVGVFLAFTIVLVPVAMVGLLVGIVALAHGVLGLGRVVASRLPVVDPRGAGALGVVVVLVGLRLVALVPVVGDLVALGILSTGLGAVLVTYFGVTRFRPDVLPD